MILITCFVYFTDSNMSNLCDRCDYVASNPSTLLNHIKAVHEKVKRFYCDLCDYACYYSPDLTKHKKFHENNPLFKARNYLGRTKNSLISETNQEQACNLCGFTGKCPTKLQHHIKDVHEKVKRFHCDLCDFACYYGYDLKKHQKFHESNPFFKARKKHKKIHDKNSVKERKCDICDKEFDSPSFLKRHVESVHENVKRYFCDVCNFGFYYFPNLRRHYKTKHGKVLIEDLTMYTRGSVKKKIYFTLPRPKRGKWIVILERL